MQHDIKGFAYGGLAGAASATLVQPFDLLKTQRQILAGKGVRMSLAQQIVNVTRAERGWRGLYDGLGAALLRQLTYTSTRMGVFNALDRPDASFVHRIASGVVAGAVGAVVGNPAEVVLIRMSADSRLPPLQQRRYRNVVDALRRISGEEGPLTLLRGVQATVSRAMLLNAAQLGTYSQAKDVLLRNGPWFQPGSIWLHTAAGMISGLVCTAASLPADVCKSRVQNMLPRLDGTLPYKGMIDCCVKTIREEGLLALWKGFLPYYLRLGPHTVLTFIFLEQLRKHF